MEQWPDTLPKPNAVLNVRTTPQVVASEKESGRVRQRRRYTKRTKSFQVKFVMSANQLYLFEGFVNHGLSGGANRFTLPLPDFATEQLGIDNIEGVIYKGEYSKTTLAGKDKWDVSFVFVSEEDRTISDLAYFIANVLCDDGTALVNAVNSYRTAVNGFDLSVDIGYGLPPISTVPVGMYHAPLFVAQGLPNSVSPTNFATEEGSGPALSLSNGEIVLASGNQRILRLPSSVNAKSVFLHYYHDATGGGLRGLISSDDGSGNSYLSHAADNSYGYDFSIDGQVADSGSLRINGVSKGTGTNLGDGTSIASGYYSIEVEFTGNNDPQNNFDILLALRATGLTPMIRGRFVCAALFSNPLSASDKTDVRNWLNNLYPNASF